MLLLAGAFPVWGAPAVFRSGLMILLGILVGLLALWGGWRVAAGKRAQFIFGLVSTYFTVSGLITAWMYGLKAVEHAMLGGAMWFGALAMLCTMVVGLLFAVIFGYFVLRLMSPRLWLAGAHWCCTFILLGSMVDFCVEQNVRFYATAGAPQPVDAVYTADGERLPLGFSFSVHDFEVTYYTDAAAAGVAEKYYLLVTEKGGAYTAHVRMADRWVPLPADSLVKEGEVLRLGERTIPCNAVQEHPQFTCPVHLISELKPAWVAVSGQVKEYKADCTVYTDHRGRPETRREQLRVNSPLVCKDWRIYLLSYHYNRITNQVTLLLQARRAPGRWYALVGMVGLIICTACWCWWKRPRTSVESADVSNQEHASAS